MALFFFILMGFIFLDLKFLRQRSLQVFESVFNFSPGQQAVYGLIFLLGLTLGLFPRMDVQRLFSFLMVFVFTIYVVRRVYFKRRLAVSLAGVAETNFKAVLASETLEVFLKWFLWLVVGSIVYKLLGRVYPAMGNAMTELAISSIFSSLIMFALIYRFSRENPHFSFSQLTGLRRNGQPLWKLVFVPVLLGVVWAVACVVMIMARVAEPQTPFNQMMSSVDSARVFMVFMLAAVVLAPFFEEVVFRGFIFYVLHSLRGRWVAVVVVAGIFALLHVEQYWGDGTAIAMVAGLGLVLTLLRLWTGSSIPGIVTHYAFNSAMAVIPLVFVLFSNPFYFEYQAKYSHLDGRAKEALLVKSIQNYPNHAVSYNDLAWLYCQEDRNLDQALVLIDQALAAEPQNYAFLDTKAEVMFKQGRVAEAIAIETELVRRHPQHPLLRKQLEKFSRSLKK